MGSRHRRSQLPSHGPLSLNAGGAGNWSARAQQQQRGESKGPAKGDGTSGTKTRLDKAVYRGRTAFTDLGQGYLRRTVEGLLRKNEMKKDPQGRGEGVNGRGSGQAPALSGGSNG